MRVARVQPANLVCWFTMRERRTPYGCSVTHVGASEESFPYQLPYQVPADIGNVDTVDTASSTDIFAQYYSMCTVADGKVVVPVYMCKIDVGISVVVSSSRFCCLTDALPISLANKKKDSLAPLADGAVADETVEVGLDLERELELVMEEANNGHMVSDDDSLEMDLGETAMPDDALDSKDWSRSNSVLSNTEFNNRFLKAMKVLEDEGDLLAPTLEESDAHIAWELEQVGAIIASHDSDFDVDAVWKEWLASAKDACT
eukprot:7404546-Lingulodinium_polyedra.AAC.1